MNACIFLVYTYMQIMWDAMRHARQGTKLVVFVVPRRVIPVLIRPLTHAFPKLTRDAENYAARAMDFGVYLRGKLLPFGVTHGVVFSGGEVRREDMCVQCCGCQDPVNVKHGVVSRCKQCNQIFCLRCDAFTHENLHNCARE
jgi:hypothetical protein